jgi:hypothetical protein
MSTNSKSLNPGHPPPSFLSRVLSKKWLRYLLLGAAFIVVIGLCFLPEVISISWHLVHGKSAQFHQWEVPVPKGWWAFTREGSLVVQKMNDSADRDSEMTVNDLGLPIGATYDSEKQRSALVEQMSKVGYVQVEEQLTRLAGEGCFCLSFSAARDPHRIRITCDVPNHRLFVYFAGNRTYAPIFYSIIHGVTKRAS